MNSGDDLLPLGPFGGCRACVYAAILLSILAGGLYIFPLEMGEKMLAVLVWASCGGGGTSMNFTSVGTPAGTYADSSGTSPSTPTNTTTVTMRVN